MSKILVVDDDSQVRALLQEMLELEGHEVRSAAEGRTALSLHGEWPTDLVILDIVMPEMEGLETIQELKRTSPGAKILAISGGARIGPSTYLEVAKKLGAAKSLAKPFSKAELLSSVEELLRA